MSLTFKLLVSSVGPDAFANAFFRNPLEGYTDWWVGFSGDIIVERRLLLLRLFGVFLVLSRAQVTQPQLKTYTQFSKLIIA